MLRLTEHADVSSDATCKEALPQTGREGLLFFYFSFCAVARWDATFGAFRGIGEGDRLQGKAELIKCNDRYKMCYADVIPGGVTEGQNGRTELLFIVYSSFASKTPPGIR